MNYRKLTMTVLSITAVLLVAPVQAADPQDLIDYRNSVMRAIGGHSAASVAIVRGQVEHDEHQLQHAEALVATTRMITALFPADSAEGDTDALARIWEEPEAFSAAVANTEQAAEAFLTAVNEGGDIGSAIRDLGMSCRSCHQDYRARR
jgi:cytochrome c556